MISLSPEPWAAIELVWVRRWSLNSQTHQWLNVAGVLSWFYWGGADWILLLRPSSRPNAPLPVL